MHAAVLTISRIQRTIMVDISGFILAPLNIYISKKCGCISQIQVCVSFHRPVLCLNVF